MLSYCIKLGILQIVGPICTHLSSYCTELSILQVIGPICTHITSCCMVGAIYSIKNCQFLYPKKFTSFKALKNPKKSHKVIELLRLRIIYSTPLSDFSIGFCCRRHQHHMEASHASSSAAHVYNITCQAHVYNIIRSSNFQLKKKSLVACAFQQSQQK